MRLEICVTCTDRAVTLYLRLRATSSPPFFLRDSRASERRGRVFRSLYYPRGKMGDSSQSTLSYLREKSIKQQVENSKPLSHFFAVVGRLGLETSSPFMKDVSIRNLFFLLFLTYIQSFGIQRHGQKRSPTFDISNELE